MSQPIENLEDWTREFFSNASRGQALLVGESRRDFARELVLLVNGLGKEGCSTTDILQAVLNACEAELLKADAPPH